MGIRNVGEGSELFSPQDYKHNHYVPEWYQKRFLPKGQSKHFYLDLRPDVVTNNGHTYTRNALYRWGPKLCFAKDDLYTTRWGDVENRDIEKFFFGKFDNESGSSVEYFSNWKCDSFSGNALKALIRYMSVQKLRTPKGLGWLRQTLRPLDKNKTLLLLQDIQNIFCTIWSECIWQIADASRSTTKFIISDHPVVVYNRECFPGSRYCEGFSDPDIRQQATHTYFPLNSDKVLILTNLSWVRDPFQKPLLFRPNPDFMRPAKMFNFLDIRVDRFLSDEEVLEINYITKMRAYRYIAAAQEEWLYPERHLQSSNWRKLGDGYLLMPDPRHMVGGGEMFVGYEGGRNDSWNEYGHKPWQAAYKDDKRADREWNAMQKFQAEWSSNYGPEYRGITYAFATAEKPPRTRIDDEYHSAECARDRAYLKQPGEKARRRRLKR